MVSLWLIAVLQATNIPIRLHISLVSVFQGASTTLDDSRSVPQLHRSLFVTRTTAFCCCIKAPVEQVKTSNLKKKQAGINRYRRTPGVNQPVCAVTSHQGPGKHSCWAQTDLPALLGPRLQSTSGLSCSSTSLYGTVGAFWTEPGLCSGQKPTKHHLQQFPVVASFKNRKI